MARNTDENDDSNINPATVASNVKNTFKQEVIKELLIGSFEDNKSKLGNDALSLVVEVAKCLVTETCLRASNQALRESCEKVDIEHVEKCLPQLVFKTHLLTALMVEENIVRKPACQFLQRHVKSLLRGDPCP